jgi:hypothetical protein
LKELIDELGEAGVALGEWAADHSFEHPIAGPISMIATGVIAYAGALNREVAVYLPPKEDA